MKTATLCSLAILLIFSQCTRVQRTHENGISEISLTIRHDQAGGQPPRHLKCTLLPDGTAIKRDLIAQETYRGVFESNDFSDLAKAVEKADFIRLAETRGLLTKPTPREIWAAIGERRVAVRVTAEPNDPLKSLADRIETLIGRVAWTKM